MSFSRPFLSERVLLNNKDHDRFFDNQQTDTINVCKVTLQGLGEASRSDQSLVWQVFLSGSSMLGAEYQRRQGDEGLEMTKHIITSVDSERNER